MMPLGAPGISKYGSLVRPDAQIVALRAHCALHCARTTLEAPPMASWSELLAPDGNIWGEEWFLSSLLGWGIMCLLDASSLPPSSFFAGG